MRSLIIKTLSPQIKGLLIRVPQRFNLAADIPVQPFVCTIVLRVPWPTALQINPQCDPPGREPAQTKQPMDAGKGCPVVAADGLRQTSSLKQAFKTALARDLSMPPKIQLPDLARSPTQMPQLQTHDLANNFFSQLIGMSVRSARLLLQTLKTIAQKPLFPLVTRLGADPIFLAER